jgi:hypothetical protein
MTNESILWRGVDLPGHDACRLLSAAGQWHLAGAAVFSHDQQPCCLNYNVVSDRDWKTVRANVSGWLGKELIELEVVVDPDLKWRLNGVEQPAVEGCIDVDLNFTPATNLLPIRRLNLAVGEAADVKAAWLRFPDFELEPLSQVYKRLEESTYHYESGGGSFVSQLKVNAVGFVTDYAGLFRAESWT